MGRLVLSGAEVWGRRGDAGTRRITNPHAPCPMLHAQCPMPK
ncbi:hypothetical protein [Nostoc linckia]|nr:hypothetical protein [Nostoc linckia]